MITFKQFIAEASSYGPRSKYLSPEMEQEHKAWGKKLAQAMKKIYDMNGGYANVSAWLYQPDYDPDTPSDITIALPRWGRTKADNFEQEELEPDIMTIGVKKAFEDAGIGIKIIKQRVHTETKKEAGWRASHVLEYQVEVTGELAKWWEKEENKHLRLYHGYSARKRKR